MTGEITAVFVDDDPDYLELVKSYLESDGHSIDVLTAHDPDDCLDLLETRDVDCVVSDYQMPEVDGLDLHERVRENRSDVPFLLYTAEGTEEVASEAIAAGVDDYVQKRWGPDGYDLLAKRIENAVAQRRAETAYREVFDSAAVGLSVHDPDTGEVLAANQRFRSIYGFGEDEDVEFEQLFGDEEPYTVERGREMVREAAEKGRESFEWRNTRKDGESVWVEVELQPARMNGVDRVLASVRDVSERKNQEERLERQKDLLERTQRIADVGGWELDLHTGDLRWTEEVARIKGVEDDVEPTLEEAVESYHPDDRHELYTSIQRAIEERGSYDEELRVRTPDGETKWVRTRGEVQTEEDGDYLRGTIQDVTERKRRERRYDAIFNNTFGFILLLSPDGRVLEVNDTALEFGGLEREDVVDRKVWNTPWVDYDEDVERFAKEAIEAAAEGDFARDEVKVQGEERNAIADTSIRPVTDASGDVVLLVVEGREITRRKERERELERTRKRLRSIFDGSPDAVYLHDDEGRFLDVNTTACERLGYSREELLDMRVVDVSPHVDQELLEEMFSEPDFTGTTMQVVHERKDGSTFPVQVNVTRVDVDGEDQFVAVVRDISEIKETERRLRRQRDRLEEFAEIVSHDLRNPLTVARGRLKMAKEDSSLEHLDEVDRAHERMEDMIEDMLELAREGDRVENLEEVSLEREARNAWGNVATGEADLDVVDDATVDADFNRLSRLLENLYANAVEHGSDRDDSSDLTVEVGVLDDGDGFYVEDNGTGIPEDARERAFDAGYTTSETGSGLGLMVVEEIAEGHGWRVDITESSEEGARFEFDAVAVHEVCSKKTAGDRTR